MSAIFAPGIGLLNRLRYPYKFWLVGVLFLMPLVLIGLVLINEVNQRIGFMAQERPGIEYIAQTRKVLQVVQRHRALHIAFLNGDASFRERMQQQQGVIENEMAALQALDERMGGLLATGGRVKQLRDGWHSLRGKTAGLDSEQSFGQHTDLLAEILALITHVANTSNLNLDSSLDSYYLAQMLVTQLPLLVEDMGQVRSIASGVTVLRMFTPESWEHLLVGSLRVSDTARLTRTRFRAVVEANPGLGADLQAEAEAVLATVARYGATIRGMLDDDDVTVTTEQIFQESSDAIDAAYGLFDRIAPAFDSLLAERIDGYKKLRLLAVAIMLSVLLAMIYVFVSFYLAVLKSITELRSGIQQVAEGDLTVRVNLATRDELRQIAGQVNEMTARFHELVGKVLGSSGQLASTAEELSATSGQTSQGIVEQMSQTDQVATAVNEMSTTVQEVARSAAATSEATHNASREVGTGHDVVRETVSNIDALAREIRDTAGLVHRLGESSDEIGNVVDVIRGIAEQTNLLALNAAIEAARAGEQGRGFAVVADEVRTLAGRTQKSTGEIQAMIEGLQSGARQAVQAMESSTSRTEESVASAARAGEALASISQSVTTITDMSAQIASAAEEQSTVAEEINRNITQIAHISEQNATSSTQVASSSRELAQMSEELQRMLAVFRV